MNIFSKGLMKIIYLFITEILSGMGLVLGRVLFFLLVLFYYYFADKIFKQLIRKTVQTSSKKNWSRTDQKMYHINTLYQV